MLCGHGTAGCHGAFHGNPYSVMDGMKLKRRDAQWVRERVGQHIRAHRPDVVVYLKLALGEEAGIDYLRREYS
jgi:hypothetical protein